MPFIRTSALTGESVLFAPERSGRPNAFAQTTTHTATNDDCPFCPGNEEQTPPEISRIAIDRGWQVRVVPNRYPVVSSSSTPSGRHEVIIETPQHATSVAELPDEQIARVFRTYVERYQAAAMQKIPYISIFKNEGWGSGQSIEHAHSQLIALNLVPDRHRREMQSFDHHRPQCPVCRPAHEQTIIEGKDFSVVVPDVPRFAYECWIVPHGHQPDFSGLTFDEIDELARLAREVVVRLRHRWPGVSFNWNFYNYPQATSAHWRLEICPRLAGLAGFELSSGMWINVVTPDAAAAELRQAN